MDAGIRHKALRSEAKGFIAHGTASIMDRASQQLPLPLRPSEEIQMGPLPGYPLGCTK